MKRLLIGGPFHGKEVEVIDTPVHITVTDNKDEKQMYRREMLNHYPTVSVVYVWEYKE